MYFWTRWWLCTMATAVAIQVAWVSFLLPRAWMVSIQDQLPASSLVAMNRGWCWGVPAAIIAATLLVARARGRRPLWRVRGYAILAAAAIVATSFTIWATTHWLGAGLVADTAPNAKQGGPAVGLWRVPRRPRIDLSSTPGGVEIVTQDRFYFDGESVVMQLLTMKAWMWRAPDDIYRLRARWQGADLQCLLPFAPWTTVATFRNGHFEEAGKGGPVVFERVSERDLEDEDRLLLQPREKHDYRRQPNGSLADAPDPM